jgi:RHS repeat-associated protein
MTTIAHPIHRPAISRLLRGILCTLTLLSAGAATARAQSDYASIPPALAPGSPAGSYRLSDIDTVNLFNGSVHVNLPLAGIQGRGGAKDVAALSWNAPARWQVVKSYDAYGGAVYGMQIDPRSDSTGSLRLGSWSAYFTRSVDVVLPCGPNYEGIFYAQYTLAQLHVVEPDGTEHEMRDTATGGQPHTNPGCTYQGQSRGREFVSTDGSGITVLFDDVIRDVVQMDMGDVTGGGGGVWLLLPDGRQLRSTADSLTMRDRNGNMITWEDHMGGASTDPDMAILPGLFSSVKDSLGRRVTPGSAPVSDCVSRGGDSQGVCSYISFKGFGGVERRIYIGTNSAYLTTHVFLPDGLSYRFYYNQYDDLVRIDLPTGGSIEYEYEPGLDGPQPAPDYRITNPIPGIYGGGPNDFHVYRRVTERRLYKEGHVLVNKQTFSKPEHTQNGNAGFVEKKVYDSNGTTLLSSEKHYFYGSANDTFNIWQPFARAAWKIGREYRTEFYDAGGNLLRAVDQAWQQRAPVSWWTGNPDGAPSNDPRVYQTITTLENGLSARTLYGFDPTVPYNSRVDVYEFDYVAPGGTETLLRLTHTDYEKSAAYTDPPPTGAYLRNLPKQQWVSTDGWGNNRVSRTDYGYDELAPTDRPNITGHDPAYSTARTVRGNLTSVTRYADAAGASGPVTTITHYDIAGNIVSVTDANGNATQISYADSFCNDNGVRCGGTFTPNTYAFPTVVTSHVPDVSSELNPSYPAGTFGSTTPLTSTNVYDFYTGLVYTATDANNQTTRMEYADPLERPTAQVRPDPTGGRTDISYAADGRSVHVFTDLDGSRRLESYQYFDGLGRLVRTQQYENSVAQTPWLTVDTQYDALGRARRTSMPYRSTQGATPLTEAEWLNTNRTETQYDALGRVRAVTTQPYAAATITDYSGDRALVKDPAGKERVGRMDALGRVTEVWEIAPQETGTEASTVALAPFPGHPEAAHGYLTSYKYDPLGNLRMVEQEGKHLGQTVTQRRFFAYDSLGRLLRAKNPEQGHIAADQYFAALEDCASGVCNSQWSAGYIYDQNGNLVKRKDARTATLGVTTDYYYDRLNRNVITKYTTPAGSGAATTPDVRRYYDGAVNGRGRLAKTETVGVSETAYDNYDELGRLTVYRQKFWWNNGWSQSYGVERAYNKAGGVTWQKYPSQRTVIYNYDAAGRLADYNGQAAFAGNLGDGTPRTYSSEVRYHALGGMEQERLGTQTPVYNKSLYNSRGQLAEIRVSTYSILTSGHETDWNRGAIINHYSNAQGAWGATGGGSDNNGNLLRQEVYIPHNDQSNPYTNIVQEYGYDSLNRLTAVYDKPSNGAPDFYQLYKYDRWGNRTIDPNSWQAPAQQFAVDAATNRLGVPAGQAGAMNYDGAGNLINDSYTHQSYGSPAGAQTRFYDGEGRMTSAQTGASQTANYAYDGDGRRVKRMVGTPGEVWQVYSVGGELLAEYAPNAAPTSPRKEYGYRGGELLVTASAASSGWGPAPVLNDNPLVVGQTIIQARHITELRDAINSLRSHMGLGAYSWQTTATAGALVKADPIAEMRTALDGALGAPSGGYAAGLAQGQPVRAVHIQELRDRVLGAWQAGGAAAGVRWLVTDQLGTPRMTLDQTGTLAGMTRHDYMPFGEEIPAEATWRTAARGYVADAVRQKFTGYERDVETGLDYAQARYFSSPQGRFISPDPYLGSSRVLRPQTWNRYSYALNNPLKFIDPTGLEAYIGGGTQEDKDREQRKKELREQGFEERDIEGHKGVLTRIDGQPGYQDSVTVTAKDKCRSCPGIGIGIGIGGGAGGGLAAGGATIASIMAGLITLWDGLPGDNAENLEGDPGGIQYMDPFSIRFTQDSINYWFDKEKTYSIDDLARDLKQGTVTPEQIPPVRLVNMNNHLASIDNRRVEAFRRAGMKIRVRPADARERWRAIVTGRFTTKNMGTSIRVRGEPRRR